MQNTPERMRHWDFVGTRSASFLRAHVLRADTTAGRTPTERDRTWRARAALGAAANASATGAFPAAARSAIAAIKLIMLPGAQRAIMLSLELQETLILFFFSSWTSVEVTKRDSGRESSCPQVPLSSAGSTGRDGGLQH